MNGFVRCTTLWDPDGVGPRTPLVVVGGPILIEGVAGQNIASYDPATGVWAGVGGGVLGDVYALTTLPDGSLIAGGYLSAGDEPAQNIARWDGAAWSGFGTGMNGPVYSMTILPSGDLIAGGWFTTAGAVAANGIARWDGTAWSALGEGLGEVFVLLAQANGDVFAGGRAGVFRWNGTAWSAFNTGLIMPSDSGVFALATLANGDLVAGGRLGTDWSSIGYGLARWDGAAWRPLGSGVSGVGAGGLPVVLALAVRPNGDLIASGMFTTAGGVRANNVARWNGVAWSTLGAPSSIDVADLTLLPDGDLIAAGAFGLASGARTPIARYHFGPLCPADINCTASLTVQDILDFVGAYFSGDAAGDFNGSGLPATVQDIFDFLGAYFAGCG